jgi:peptide/nickel transport system permease protein
MFFYLLRRLVGVVGVVAATTILVFCIINLLPGNVAYAILGEFATPSAVAVLEAKLGLNDPLWLQYWHWLSKLLHGDFGDSLMMNRPAGPLIFDALARSALLGIFAFVLVTVCGVGAGIYSAMRVGRSSDHFLTLVQLTFIAVPEFFWAILAILVFSSLLGWLPATGYVPISAGFGDWAAHLIMPVVVLALGLIAHVSRLTRAAMLEALRSRYVLMARAKGLGERRVLWKHALPNAMLPTITILAIDFGLLIGGIVVVETVFAYPGLGRLLVFAIEHHDLPLLQAGMLMLTTIYAVANLVADLAYAALNPRIRYTVTAA